MHPSAQKYPAVRYLFSVPSSPAKATACHGVKGDPKTGPPHCHQLGRNPAQPHHAPLLARLLGHMLCSSCCTAVWEVTRQ